MTPDLKTMFPRASRSFIEANQQNTVQPIVDRKNGKHETFNNSKPQDPKLKPTLCDESVGTDEGKASHSNRCIVRITSFRVRLTDPDNLCPKYFIDSLRYAGAIPDDREEDIELTTSQEKVKSYGEEKTVIEIEV
jgi:hypothetical protein